MLSIDYINELSTIKDEISYLKVIIENSDEMVKLKMLENQVCEINKKINMYSTYEVEQIGNALLKLMEQFEGINYCIEKNFLFFEKIIITPKYRLKAEYDHVYKDYCFETEEKKYYFDDKDEKKCILYPSSYNSKNEFNYIQVFIDFLFNERVSKKLFGITDEQLDQLLCSFISLSKELQKKRKIEIDSAIQNNLEIIKKKEFEKSCNIDRKLIFNTLVYILNNYENGIIAGIFNEEEKEYSSQWTNLNGYSVLSISDGDKLVKYKALVDTYGCYPDEEYCGMRINMSKDSKINFFEFRKELSCILKECNYANYFLDLIEDEFNKTKNINSNLIESILIDLSNQKKDSKKLVKSHSNSITLL